MSNLLQIETEVLGWLANLDIKDCESRMAGPQVYMRSSIGKRESNQDRAVFVQIGVQRYARAPLACAVVADGMGGMADGGLAASIALSAFIGFLAEGRASAGLKSLLLAATLYANDRVHHRFGGQGGTTLSAILYGKQGLIGINVGDSRLYAIAHDGPQRLTVDDSLADQLRKIHAPVFEDASGERDSRLIQFVGIGPQIEPHIIELESNGEQGFIISTDGAHYLGDKVMDELVRAGLEPNHLPMTALDISRICGSTDNASIISVPKTMHFDESIVGRYVIKVASPGHSLVIATGAESTTVRENPSDVTSTEKSVVVTDDSKKADEGNITSAPGKKQAKTAKKTKGAAKRPRQKSESNKKKPSPSIQPVLEFLEPQIDEKTKRQKN
jgi:serine/threonine protein phosphatase PrpC